MAWPIIGIILTGGALVVDWLISRSIDDSVSQMEIYYKFFNAQTTVSEFLASAWPSLAIIAGSLIVGYMIAHPKRRGRRA